MIERYLHSVHFPLISAWLAEREIPVPDPRVLPDCGFLSHGIALGFLITTNSKIARIENVIVDPRASQSDRDIALLALFNALEEEAKKRGYIALEMLTAGTNMRARLAFRKFRKHGDFVLMFKEI